MILKQIAEWYDFSGRTAVVTGGTGVLGGAIATALAATGANVAILARNPSVPTDQEALGENPAECNPGDPEGA